MQTLLSSTHFRPRCIAKRRIVPPQPQPRARYRNGRDDRDDFTDRASACSKYCQSESQSIVPNGGRKSAWRARGECAIEAANCLLASSGIRRSTRHRLWPDLIRKEPSDMSYAVRIHAYGGPEVLTYEDVPVGEPGARRGSASPARHRRQFHRYLSARRPLQARRACRRYSARKGRAR